MTTLLVTQAMLDSKKQEIQRIISLSVILHYVHYFHPNIKIFTKIQVHVWLQMFHICQKYTFIITFMAWSLITKNSSIKAKNLKKEGLGGNQIAYTKHIKIQSCHMWVIFTPKHMIWQRQEFVHIHSYIMRYHTGNVSLDFVPNVQVLIFLTKKQIISIPTQVLPFVFAFII